jgi:hypothetical protein
VVWVPRTAVGEGESRGGDGEAEAGTLLDGVAGAEGDPICVVAEGTGEVVTVDGEDGAAADGDAPWVTVGEGAVALADGLELA